MSATFAFYCCRFGEIENVEIITNRALFEVNRNRNADSVGESFKVCDSNQRNEVFLQVSSVVSERAFRVVKNIAETSKKVCGDVATTVASFQCLLNAPTTAGF